MEYASWPGSCCCLEGERALTVGRQLRRPLAAVRGPRRHRRGTRLDRHPALPQVAVAEPVSSWFQIAAFPIVQAPLGQSRGRADPSMQ